MKTYVNTIVLALFAVLTTYAQPPQAFKYQAVVRDASGDIIQNQAVGIRISIRNIWTGGTILYQETFTETTNNFGLVNLEIGNGATTFGIFTNIQWGIDKKFIEIEIDTGGGYVSMGTSEFLSVPYALHAGSTNDTSVWKYNGNRLYYNGGRVGIGTTNPSNMLHVEATGNEYGIYGGSTGGFGVTGKTSADAHAGVIGIGNSATSFGLQALNNYGGTALVAQSSSGLAGHFIGDIKIDDDSPYLNFYSGSTQKGFMGVYTDDDMNIYNTTTGNLKFGTNSIEHMRITSIGNVGIGTVAPNYRLDVFGMIRTNGIKINIPYNYGIYIENPYNEGVRVDYAGGSAFFAFAPVADGLYVQSAGNDGVSIYNSDDDGIYVKASGDDGVFIEDPLDAGIYVNNAGGQGVYVSGSGYAGVYVSNSSIDWGFYAFNDRTYSAGGYYPTKSGSFALNTGSANLEVGDMVCISGGYVSNVLGEESTPVINVAKANSQNSQSIFGVVESRVYIHEKSEEKENGETLLQKSFRFEEGIIGQDDYLAVIVFGVADVKVNPEEPILSGDAIVAGDGMVRKAQTTEINGIIFTENTGILGKALEDSNGKDKIKVFVNCK